MLFGWKAIPRITTLFSLDCSTPTHVLSILLPSSSKLMLSPHSSHRDPWCWLTRCCAVSMFWHHSCPSEGFVISGETVWIGPDSKRLWSKSRLSLASFVRKDIKTLFLYQLNTSTGELQGKEEYWETRREMLSARSYLPHPRQMRSWANAGRHRRMCMWDGAAAALLPAFLRELRFIFSSSLWPQPSEPCQTLLRNDLNILLLFIIPQLHQVPLLMLLSSIFLFHLSWTHIKYFAPVPSSSSSSSLSHLLLSLQF